jgi:hypothetical protein
MGCSEIWVGLFHRKEEVRRLSEKEKRKEREDIGAIVRLSRREIRRAWCQRSISRFWGGKGSLRGDP